MTGEADFTENENLVDYNGDSFETVLRTYGSDPQKFQESIRNLNELETFAEVHIEQGKKLEQENLPVGIVCDIHEDTRDEVLEMIVQEAESIAENRGIYYDMNLTTRIEPIPIKKSCRIN